MNPSHTVQIQLVELNSNPNSIRVDYNPRNIAYYNYAAQYRAKLGREFLSWHNTSCIGVF